MNLNEFLLHGSTENNFDSADFIFDLILLFTDRLNE